MILDVFGICQQDANGECLFLECDGEFKHIEECYHEVRALSLKETI